MGKNDPIIWISSNWLNFRRVVHCCKLITILILIFLHFLSFLLIWTFSKMTEILYRDTLLYAYYNFSVHFYFFIFFDGQFGLKIWSSLNWLKFQILGPNSPKKHFRVEYYDKRDLKITYYNMVGFKWFQVVSAWFQVFSSGSRLFQAVPCFSKYAHNDIYLTFYSQNMLKLVYKYLFQKS